MPRAVLAVHMTHADRAILEDGGQLVSHDNRFQEVGAFCDKHGLPYSATFQSIAVYVNQVSSGSVGHAYGNGEETAILKDDVLSSIEVVCSDDFQDVCFNAYNREKRREKIQGMLRCFSDLRGMDIGEKGAALLLAAQNASSIKYAEARIFRPLTIKDVQSW